MKKFASGFSVMRLQHVHLAHQYLIDKGLELCETFLVLVGCERTTTERNPFSYETRLMLLEEIYKENPNIQFTPLYENFSILKSDWGGYVLSQASLHLQQPPQLMLYGERDVVDDDRKNWFPDGSIELMTCDSGISISATELRNFLIQNDFSSWSHYVDSRIHPFFELLRNELCLSN